MGPPMPAHNKSGVRMPLFDSVKGVYRHERDVWISKKLESSENDMVFISDWRRRGSRRIDTAAHAYAQKKKPTLSSASQKTSLRLIKINNSQFFASLAVILSNRRYLRTLERWQHPSGCRQIRPRLCAASVRSGSEAFVISAGLILFDHWGNTRILDDWPFRLAESPHQLRRTIDIVSHQIMRSQRHPLVERHVGEAVALEHFQEP